MIMVDMLALSPGGFVLAGDAMPYITYKVGLNEMKPNGFFL